MGLVRLTGPMDQPAIGTGTCMINLERAGPGLDYAKERAMGLTCPLSFEPHHNFNHSTIDYTGRPAADEEEDEIRSSIPKENNRSTGHDNCVLWRDSSYNASIYGQTRCIVRV